MTWTPPMDCLENDIFNSIHAIEYYITSIEDELIKDNAGNSEWDKLTPYKKTLENLKFMVSIYYNK